MISYWMLVFVPDAYWGNFRGLRPLGVPDRKSRPSGTLVRPSAASPGA